MGQKVHPTGMRLGYIEEWKSVWYADSKDYSNTLNNDLKVREYLDKELKNASVAKVLIERPAQNAKVVIYTARPGAVFGRKNENLDKIRAGIAKIMGISVKIDIKEVKKPELVAKLVAEDIAQQLEKRVMFRRAMKKAVQVAMKSGAEGAKVTISGRIGGAEIARSEWHREGRVPLHTFRANIDYATSEALTTYGILGIKVWIFKGEILSGSIKNKYEEDEDKSKKNQRKRPGRRQRGAK